MGKDELKLLKPLDNPNKSTYLSSACFVPEILSGNEDIFIVPPALWVGLIKMDKKVWCNKMLFLLHQNKISKCFWVKMRFLSNKHLQEILLNIR